MMKILFKKLILFSIVFLTACSSPMNKSYERDQSEKDLEFIKNSSVIDNHDYGLLCLYIGFYEDKCHGKPYAEILLNAKEHEEEFINLKKIIAFNRKNNKKEKKSLNKYVFPEIYSLLYVRYFFNN